MEAAGGLQQVDHDLAGREELSADRLVLRSLSGALVCGQQNLARPENASSKAAARSRRLSSPGRRLLTLRILAAGELGSQRPNSQLLRRLFFHGRASSV